MICSECSADVTYEYAGMTLVGFYSPPGHNHDDNCYKRHYSCKCGHEWVESIIRTCPRPDCDWQGKTECFCHPGQKVKQWTDEETQTPQ